MSIVLGIDTGGTYTDGVIVELSQKRILTKAKALTTREDLALGIRECIDNLQFHDFQTIGAVSLSTTLATNAIVEGRGCEVGLILIGHEPIGQLPTKHVAVVPGGHDIKGMMEEELDIGMARRALEEFRGRIDAVAVSGYLSIRNPSHELQIRDLVQEMLGLPVVCAHQLTTSLGFHERTVTAVLNARLIPIIAELIQSVQQVLKEKSIDAPVMIVKGDGCLMSEIMAREKPIDTILSGPASSIIGGTFLTETSEALVLDMGGTTTDIALLNNGVPRLNQEGAMVGGWLTRVQAAEIYTYGLGGDSYLQVSNEGRLVVGPQRVWPLCVVAHRYPYLVRELKSFCMDDYNLMFAQATDCFMFLKNSAVEELSSMEKRVVETLQEGPHSLFYLADKLEIDPILFNFQHLVNLGIIARVSLTPTDILHARGLYTQWNTEAARLGAEILARRMGGTFADFLKLASEEIVNSVCLAVVQSVLGCEGNRTWIKENNEIMYFMDKALKKNKGRFLDCALKVRIPIVGIGAPVEAWLPLAAEKLETELVIPEHAEVANAVGAATGKIMETVSVLVKPGDDYGGYLVHAPWEFRVFEELEEAVAYAESGAKEYAARNAEKAGAKNFELIVNREEVYTGIQFTKDKIFIECRIKVTAVGRSDWERE